MPKKPKDSEESRRGRRPGDPEAKRSERLVLRVHPDLIDALNGSADEAGLTRSLFIERILVTYIRQDPRYSDMDAMGRRSEGVAAPPLASVRSFEQRWDRFAAMRRAALGEDIPPAAPELDDYGRPEDGSRARHEPRPPVPEHLRQPRAADRIFPTRSANRKDRRRDDDQ